MEQHYNTTGKHSLECSNQIPFWVNREGAQLCKLKARLYYDDVFFLLVTFIYQLKRSKKEVLFFGGFFLQYHASSSRIIVLLVCISIILTEICTRDHL